MGNYSEEVRDESMFVAPPPLDADGLRASILALLAQYRHLLADSSESDEKSLQQTTSASPHAIRLGIVQNALLRDIQQLSSLTTQLEKNLDDKRWIKWFLNPCLAALSHIVYLQLFNFPYFGSYSPFRQRHGFGQNRPRAALAVLSCVPWIVYPIALIRIRSFEVQVSKTADLRRALTAVEGEVQRGVLIKNDGFLQDSHWFRIPWDT